MATELKQWYSQKEPGLSYVLNYKLFYSSTYLLIDWHALQGRIGFVLEAEHWLLAQALHQEGVPEDKV